MLKDMLEQHQIILNEQTGLGVKIAVMESCFNTNHPAIQQVLSDPKEWYSGAYDCHGDDELVQLKIITSFDSPCANHANDVMGLIAGIDHLTNVPLGLATGATLVPVCGINS